MAADGVIHVKPAQLKNIAGDLGSIYSKLSDTRNQLERLHAGVRANWSDPAVDDFTAKYNVFMDRIWDLLVAVDSMESFLTEAADSYMAADRKIQSL